MIPFLNFLSFLFAWGYTFVFFWIIRTFIPLRKNLFLKIAAFLVCGYLADSIIYANDAGSLFGTMAGFFIYVLIFYRGTFMEKLSVLLVFILYFMPEDTLIAYPICGASIFSSFGCMYLASYICDSMQTAYRAQELQMQKDYYKDRIRDEERVRRIYHDMKNHLLILESQPGTDETKRAARELQEKISDYENYVHTGNEFLDIIIRDKSAKAREKHIDFNAVIHFENGDFIEPLDISTIFGNAIDNAIESSEKLPEERRLVTVKAAKIRDMLMITAENNMQEDQGIPEGTTKEDRFLHGFGIPNIKKAVEKYDGQCSVSAEDGVFRLKVLIPV